MIMSSLGVLLGRGCAEMHSSFGCLDSGSWSLVARLRAEGVLVEEILAKTAAHSAQVGDIVRQLLDRFHLLGEVVGLEKIGKLRVVVLRRDRVQVQQRLVHGLLELQRRLHSLQARTPVLLDGLWNIVQGDATAALILELHQLLRVFALLFARFAEELLKARQSNIVAIEVKGQLLVDIRSVQFQIDLLVDASLAFLVKVHSNLGDIGHGRCLSE